MIYEYKCTGCGFKFEESLPVDERDNPVGGVCPWCEEGTFKRLIRNISFVLKGGGWAKDGYTKESK